METIIYSSAHCSKKEFQTNCFLFFFQRSQWLSHAQVFRLDGIPMSLERSAGLTRTASTLGFVESVGLIHWQLSVRNEWEESKSIREITFLLCSLRRRLHTRDARVYPRHKTHPTTARARISKKSRHSQQRLYHWRSFSRRLRITKVAELETGSPCQLASYSTLVCSRRLDFTVL